MKYLRGFAVTLAAIYAAGCASILSDNDYAVTLRSEPGDARYTIKDGEGVIIGTGQTPNTVYLKSSAGYFKPARYTISYQKEGYLDTTSQLSATMDGWYVGNILLGGMLGMLIVDPATGAMWSMPDDHAVAIQELPQFPGVQPVSRTRAKDGQSAPEKIAKRDAAPAQEVPDVPEELTSPKPEVTVTESVDDAAPAGTGDNDKPVGYDKAVLLAKSNGCHSYIRVDYAAANGATYSTACANGEHTLIMCNASTCRMVE